MAKALLGQRVYRNDSLILESARLRSRVRDLEALIEDLQHDNDRLRDNVRLRDNDPMRDGDRLRETERTRVEQPVEVGAARQPVH